MGGHDTQRTTSARLYSLERTMAEFREDIRASLGLEVREQRDLEGRVISYGYHWHQQDADGVCTNYIFYGYPEPLAALQAGLVEGFRSGLTVYVRGEAELCGWIERCTVKEEGGRRKEEGGRMKDESSAFILHPSSFRIGGMMTIDEFQACRRRYVCWRMPFDLQCKRWLRLRMACAGPRRQGSRSRLAHLLATIAWRVAKGGDQGCGTI